jgi:hypothetical protein
MAAAPRRVSGSASPSLEPSPTRSVTWSPRSKGLGASEGKVHA